jgi:hypothetical protein
MVVLAVAYVAKPLVKQLGTAVGSWLWNKGEPRHGQCADMAS